MRTQPALPKLELPPPNLNDETALFQHAPTPGTKVRQEWEPGCQPDEVYDAALPAWRARARRYLVRRLHVEKKWMADWQLRVRTEGRDKYFYWTAIFGTHTFFNAFLPLFFWYGDPAKGRGLLNAVGLGIYMSSFAKDLVCTPRPYSPPVVRLAMSTHAHEYGFPSSHSTNTLTIALFLGQWVWEVRSAIGPIATSIASLILMVYMVSVVGGRVYTGMHSIADVVGGSLMGIACWATGLLVEAPLELWTTSGSLTVPLLGIPLTLACVHYHPEPVDPCPCFEDAIAVLSVMLGGVLGHWYEVRNGLVATALATEVWGRGPIIGATIVLERLVLGKLAQLLSGSDRELMSGIAIVFGWRILAKRTLLRVLPTIFRVYSKTLDVDLPTRQGYTAATDYKGFPQTPIRSVPSFLDMAQADSSAEATPVDSPTDLLAARGSMSGSLNPLDIPDAALRRRGSGRTAEATTKKAGPAGPAKAKRSTRPTEIKFDVEVLTKVIVYLGIGLLACTIIPYIFSWIEDRLL
ncbi:sphingosine-1-phosphate phosphatase [Dioszegia hungarica]|uniref:Sphingosine-1-phosphate phosphatase n=1 Tax=Dioszegia hungarica TaxID=4972 RepID=A0AA38HCW2_9TREE|nr:sphingosine-1-phosphate phosphatase [Dioszegia hungarica]KAI9636684.1 sphingosine-1-phosphate phosphatase [Dioszegia hungarica]